MVYFLLRPGAFAFQAHSVVIAALAGNAIIVGRTYNFILHDHGGRPLLLLIGGCAIGSCVTVTFQLNSIPADKRNGIIIGTQTEAKTTAINQRWFTSCCGIVRPCIFAPVPCSFQLNLISSGVRLESEVRHTSDVCKVGTKGGREQATNRG
jgi:hypothetical protein